MILCVCTGSTELPVWPKIKFFQVYASTVADISQIGVTAVDHPNLSHLLGRIELFFFIAIVVFIRAILVL